MSRWTRAQPSHATPWNAEPAYKGIWQSAVVRRARNG